MQAENARLKRIYADMAMQNEFVKEAIAKKVMRPSISGRVLRCDVPRGFRREMANYAVDERGVSVAFECRAFSISQRCFRFVPLLDDQMKKSKIG